MEVRVKQNEVTISGYINAVERNSKILESRLGRFIERIRKGAFSKAIERNHDIHALMNHNWELDLGSTATGNVKLKEDSIGLWGEVRTSHPEAIKAAREKTLVGWSFGFRDTKDGVERKMEEGIPLRILKDLNLEEVSILTKDFSPAYEGTLIMARAEGEDLYTSETFIPDDIEVRFEEEPEGQMQTAPESEVAAADKKPIDYSLYESKIQKMKGAKA